MTIAVTSPTDIQSHGDLKISNVRFDAAGVSIPFPQRDVHLYKTD